MTTTRNHLTRRALVAGLALLALTGVASCGADSEQGMAAADPASVQAAPDLSGSPAIDGVEFYSNLARDHVTTKVTYQQSPAVGGAHNSRWTNCGIYTEPVEEMRAVHSMEHGAVWVTYRPDLPAAQIQELTDLISTKSFVVLSLYPGQDPPVTATAWGLQLALDTADDPRLQSFLRTYIQGQQTPEPGAPCTGGVDG